MKPCIKCGSAMRAYNGLSRCSSLARVDETHQVNGWSCPMCGRWEEPEVTPVCPMPPKGRLAPPVSCLTESDRIAWRHRGKINRMLATKRTDRTPEIIDLIMKHAMLSGVSVRHASIVRSIGKLRNGSLEAMLGGGE